jgi:phenylpropionate dioxygenase-like ring-hydroxylating dioxygenase large terminal subunit
MSNVAPLRAGGPGQLPPGCEVGEHSLGTGRYIDPAFARLERDKLWLKVWQMAARLDEIPAPGDYTTYDIIDQSVMVVRVDANTIKAYHNFCPHRGTALSSGCGHFERERIICPFHGWRWDLKGQIQFVLERQEFCGGKLQDADIALREVRSEVFAGFVFINFDRNAQPFADFIAPVKQRIEDLGLGLMHHYWWKSLKVPSNWKVAQEAFHEAYHLPATHPQLDAAGREVIYGDRKDAPWGHLNVSYETFANGHGRFYGGARTPMQGYTPPEQEGDPVEKMIRRLELLVTGLDAMVLPEDLETAKALRGRKIPAGSNLGAEYVKLLYERAAMQKRPMPEPKPENFAQWGGEVFVFPNLLLLPNAGNLMFYRVRPDGLDPDRCIFEIFSTRTYAPTDPFERAVVQPMTDGLDPKQFNLIPRQDVSNIPRIQRGLHSSGMKKVWLASYNESVIMNMHQELDRYLRA